MEWLRRESLPRFGARNRPGVLSADGDANNYRNQHRCRRRGVDVDQLTKRRQWCARLRFESGSRRHGQHLVEQRAPDLYRRRLGRILLFLLVQSLSGQSGGALQFDRGHLGFGRKCSGRPCGLAHSNRPTRCGDVRRPEHSVDYECNRCHRRSMAFRGRDTAGHRHRCRSWHALVP